MLQEFENISFKDGKLVDDFVLRINTLSEELRGLGEKIEESRVVKKMLRVLPKKYSQIAVSIELLLDPKKISVETLVGHLKVAEDRFEVEEVTDKAGRLLLTEED